MRPQRGSEITSAFAAMQRGNPWLSHCGLSKNLIVFVLVFALVGGPWALGPLWAPLGPLWAPLGPLWAPLLRYLSSKLWLECSQ